MNENEFEVIEKFIPPRNIRCKDCMNNPIPNLIKEFINDFEWYMAFDIHFKWVSHKGCICKTDPIRFKNWILQKWQKKYQRETMIK